MAWKILGSGAYWWPDDLDPERKKILEEHFMWPRLYVTGDIEDDKTIQFLQSIGQPFLMMELSDVNEEEKIRAGILSYGVTFLSEMTTFALVGFEKIKQQFEFEARSNHIPFDQIRRVTLPRPATSTNFNKFYKTVATVSENGFW